MKTATQITITIDGQQHVLPTLEHAVGLLQSSLTFELSSAAAHLASQLRLGGVLWQVRQAADSMLGERAGREEWKRLIVRAGIDEKRAQRCMRVSAAIAQGGVVQPALVARLQERARAIGCTQAFTARMPRTFDEATKLVSIACATGPQAQTTNKLGSGVFPSSGNGKTANLNGGPQAQTTNKLGSGVFPSSGNGKTSHGVPDDSELEGNEAVARAMGMSVGEYMQYLAELDAEEQAEDAAVENTSGPTASTQDQGLRTLDRRPTDHQGGSAPQGPRTLGAKGLQMGLDALFIQRERIAALMERAMGQVATGRVDAGGLASVMREFEAHLDGLVEGPGDGSA